MKPKIYAQMGLVFVYIQYCLSSTTRTILNTGICIPPSYWSVENECISFDLPAQYGQPDELNDDIKRMFRNAEDILTAALRREIAEPHKLLKQTFRTNLTDLEAKSLGATIDNKDIRVNKDFFFQFDDYVQSKIKKVSKDTPKNYETIKKRLKQFETFRKKTISFEDLDYSFYEELVDFLRYDYVHFNSDDVTGLKTNSIGTTIKQLRIFLNNRALKKLISPVNMSGWKILEEEADTVYCSWEEVYAIANTDLSGHQYLEPYRDDFVLGCYLGMRFSDFSTLEESDLRNDLLHKKQKKSDSTVVIPLRDTARTILEKRFSRKLKGHTNPEFNRHIKTVAMLAGIVEQVKHTYKKGNQKIVEIRPKSEWITSHTCRRSFCTNEFLAGTPVELIMKISGHKSVKDFYKYIRISNEEAAEKIKQLWVHRGQISQNTQPEIIRLTSDK